MRHDEPIPIGDGSSVTIGMQWPDGPRRHPRRTASGFRRAAVDIVAIGALAVTGCTGDGDPSADAGQSAPVVQLGAPGETNRVLTDDEIAAIEVPTYTGADVEFVHGMLAHHQQALVMTALVAERSERADLPLVVERMDISQRDEIAQMERWLDERGEGLAHGDDHIGHMGLMPGMLTDDELDELRAASGPEFDRLFLEGMIRHHQGALVMVDDLLTSGVGGQEPELYQLAQHVASDQQIEIARMLELLAAVRVDAGS